MLEGLQPPKRQKPCKVREILIGLDNNDQDVLETALADFKNWSARSLELALKQRGITISDSSIERHRSGLCSC